VANVFKFRTPTIYISESIADLFVYRFAQTDCKNCALLLFMK